MISLLSQIDLGSLDTLQSLSIVGFLCLGYLVLGYLILFSDTLVTGKQHREDKANYEKYIALKDEQITILKTERDEYRGENAEQNRDLVRLTEDFKALFRDVISTRMAAGFQRGNGESSQL